MTVEDNSFSSAPSSLVLCASVLYEHPQYRVIPSFCVTCVPHGVAVLLQFDGHLAGVVMALYALLRSNPSASAEEIEGGLDGNLCRCTGEEISTASLQIYNDRKNPATFLLD